VTLIRICFENNIVIEYSRIQGIPRNERLCLCCNQNLVETEFHFIFICSKYNDIRSKYQLNYPWPNVNKFISIMKSTRRIHQLKIATHLKESFNRRNLFIEHLNIYLGYYRLQLTTFCNIM